MKLNKETGEPHARALARLAEPGRGRGRVESSRVDVMCCGTGAPFAVGGNNPRNIPNGDLVSLTAPV